MSETKTKYAKRAQTHSYQTKFESEQEWGSHPQREPVGNLAQ